MKPLPLRQSELEEREREEEHDCGVASARRFAALVSFKTGQYIGNEMNVFCLQNSFSRLG